MDIVNTGVAGTMESSDIIVTVEPRNAGGIQLTLQSSVMQQFGKQIEKVIRDTMAELCVKNAVITAVYKCALDCTVRARVLTAAYRAANSDAYTWEVQK